MESTPAPATATSAASPAPATTTAEGPAGLIGTAEERFRGDGRVERTLGDGGNVRKYEGWNGVQAKGRREPCQVRGGTARTKHGGPKAKVGKQRSDAVQKILAAGGAERWAYPRSDKTGNDGENDEEQHVGTSPAQCDY